MKKLGTPSPRHIGRPAGSTPQLDAVPEDRFKGTDAATVKALSDLVGADNVLHRISDLVRCASDASAYRLIPQVVVRPRDARDIAAVMQWANDNGRHIVFRSAGTSLNGQSITDDILMDLKTHFGGMRVLDAGERLWSRPGVILGDAQAVLSRHGYMIGADPGSTSVCTIGGVLADNSGGMRCSVDRDSYHTLEDATFVLPSGTIVDTTSPTADADLKAAEPQLYQGLVDIAERIRSDAELSAFLRKKFTIRSTNGLRLDAFLDEVSPTRMLMRLLVSSEGIFGAITESVIRTVKLPRHKAVAWVMLPSLRDAASYVHALVQAGAEACELLVAPVLRGAVGNSRWVAPPKKNSTRPSHEPNQYSPTQSTWNPPCSTRPKKVCAGPGRSAVACSACLVPAARMEAPTSRRTCVLLPKTSVMLAPTFSICSPNTTIPRWSWATRRSATSTFQCSPG